MKKKELVGGLIMTALLLSACVGNPTQKSEKRIETIPVRVMQVSHTQNTETKNYIGTAEAAKSAWLRCRYPGRLVSINVKKGDRVKAGTVIAEIESPNVISAGEMAYSTLKQAEDGYARSARLHEKGSISDVKMVEIETQLAKARSAAEAADKALEDCKVKAPYDGIIDDILVDEGIDTDPLTNIARIMDVSSVEIRFPVPETEVGKISVGGSAIVAVPALDVSGVPARIVSKGMTASPLSHTYEYCLKLKENLPGLMPGMVTKVYLDSEGVHGVVIPASVVRTDDAGRYVWCVDDDVVVKKYVTPAGFSGQGIVVTEGLEDGDRIITEGVQKVCTGMKVRVVE